MTGAGRERSGRLPAAAAGGARPPGRVRTALRQGGRHHGPKHRGQDGGAEGVTRRLAAEWLYWQAQYSTQGVRL